MSGSGLFGEYVVKWSGEGVAAEPLAQVNRYVTSRRTTGLITCRSRGPVVRGAVMGDLRVSQPSDRPTCSAKIFGRETVDSASGAASLILIEQGRSVGSLGPGLTSDSADAVRAVLRDDLSAGPQVLWHLPAALV
jgi:hypothetical protein